MKCALCEKDFDVLYYHRYGNYCKECIIRRYGKRVLEECEPFTSEDTEKLNRTPYKGKTSFAHELKITKDVLVYAINELKLDDSKGFGDYTQTDIDKIMHSDAVKRYKERIAEQKKHQNHMRIGQDNLFEHSNNYVDVPQAINRIESKINHLFNMLVYIHDVDLNKFYEWEQNQDTHQ